MRFLLKLLFAPVMAVLAVVSWFLVFVVGLSSGILCIPAAILGFFGLFILFVDSVSYGVGPVSYTHLDVYKRQVQALGHLVSVS